MDEISQDKQRVRLGKKSLVKLQNSNNVKLANIFS